MTKSLEPGLASQGTCRKSGCRSWSIENTKATYSFSSVSRFDTIDSSKIVMKRSVCFCITASINIPHGGLCIAIKDSQRKPQGQIWEAWTWIVSQPGVARKGRWFSPRSILRVPGMSSNAKVKYWATPVNCINKKVGTFLPFWTLMLAQPTQQSIHLSAVWQYSSNVCLVSTSFNQRVTSR